MTSGSNQRTSFFDDDNLSKLFEFQAPENKHQKDLLSPITISGMLLRETSPGGPLQQSYYILYSHILACYKTTTSPQPEFVIDIAHSRMYPLPLSMNTANYGFAITRNGNKYEFFSSDEKSIESWTNALKTICVLTNFHDEYKAQKMIGKGSFAKVYLVESKTNGKTFAVKAFTKESVFAANKGNAKAAMLNEIDIMRALDHENVIKLYEVYETEKSIYLVLELLQGRSLQEILKKGGFKDNEPRMMNVISSILEALAYLASKGVMHRDLKPDNILLDKTDKIKIVDFGLATFIDVPEFIFKKCGTPGYIAPEVFKYDPKNPQTNYDDHSDVFSTGCILYYMLFGTPFFDGANASEILKVNRKFAPDFQSLQNVRQEFQNPASRMSKEALDLLVQLLDFDHKRRPAALQALNHPFVANIIHQKHAGTYDFYQSGGSSPTVFDKRGSFLQDHYLQINKSATQNPTPHRFAEKDSLYLDLGRPEINGRIDTLTNGSANSSMLLASRVQSNADTSPLSGSTFSKGLRHHGSFKGHLPTGQSDVLKSSLYRNMHYGNESGETPDSGLLKSRLDEIKNDRRASDFLSSHPHSPSPFSGYQLNSPTLPYQPQTGGFSDSLQSHQYSIDANEKARINAQYKPTAKYNDPSMPRLSLMNQNQKIYEKDY